MTANLRVDAAIVDDFPFFAVWVHDVVGIVTAVMAKAGLKMFSQHLCGALSGQPGHLNFATKILVLEIKGHMAHPAVLHRWLR